MFNFEKLTVWEKAIDFADSVYGMSRHFPADDRFGLTSQMRRAAVSVSPNIAEGSSRASRIDFARFAEIAVGSVFETVSQAVVSKRQGFLDEAEFAKLYAAAEELSRMLSGSRKSLIES